MSAELKLKANSGGSLSLACDDSLTTDEVVVIPKDMVKGLATAWVYASGDATTGNNETLYGSMNIAQINKLEDAHAQVTFTEPMDNANYNVVVSDANNCLLTDNISITQPTQLTNSLTGINAKCYNITLEAGATITVNGNLEIEK